MSEKQSPPLLEELSAPSQEPPGEGGPKPSRHGWIWLLVLIAAGVTAYLLFLRPKQPSSQPSNASTPSGAGGGRARGGGIAPVVAVKATRGDIGVYVNGLGAVTPIYTVTVRTQINGYLMNALYKEGQTVHQGDLLAQIDQRPYEVQLEQAEGNLAKDRATLNNARVDLQRYQTLLTHNAVPEQTLATQAALVEQDEGIVKADQAAIDSAKLNLTYCRIVAPITGRVGLRLVDPGNYVSTADSTGLVVITQLQPITVVFPISETQLPAFFQKWRAGMRLRVDVYDSDWKTKLATGPLTTVDNQIDPTTATVKLRATFDNRNDVLFPNQFVNARLLVEQKRSVTLVPSAVIQRNSQQTYVWVVKPDSTVTVRQVSLGTSEGDQTEVTSGLNSGETVVMTGVDRLQEGSKVNAQIEAPKGSAGPATNRAPKQNSPTQSVPRQSAPLQR